MPRYLTLRLYVRGLMSVLVWLSTLTLAAPAQAQGDTPQAINAAILYVATTGSDGGGNDCLDSSTPCLTIPYAISLASAGDEIRVAAGVYTSAVLVNIGITITGGFDPTGPDGWTTPTPAQTPSILDGENDRRPLYVTGSGGNGLTFQHFTIRNGNASFKLVNGPDVPNVGGGVLIYNADDVTLRDLILQNNTATTLAGQGFGGAIALISVTRARLEDITASGNRANTFGGLTLGYGGAFYLNGDNITGVLSGGDIAMERIHLFNNIAGGEALGVGGALAIAGGTATLVHGDITANSTGDGVNGLGGGLALLNGTNTIIKQTTILSNTSTGGGGGIGLQGDDGSVITLAANVPAGKVITELNTLIIARNAAATGGALAIQGSQQVVPTIYYSTLADNNLDVAAAGLAAATAAVHIAGTPATAHSLSFISSIIGGNDTAVESTANPAPLVTTYGMFLDEDVNTVNGGNAPAPPVPLPRGDVLYTNPAAGDYHLAPRSPVIDLLAFSDHFDIDGDKFTPNNVCTPFKPECGSGKLEDYGADEFQYTTATIRYVATSGDNTDNNCLNLDKPCKTPGFASDLSLGGDEIRVATGVYSGAHSINCTTAVLCITEAISVSGGYSVNNWLTPTADPALTVIDGDATRRGVEVTYSDTLSSGLFQLFTVRNGLTPLNGSGGGMEFNVGGAGPAQNFVVRQVDIFNNQADNIGGGLSALEPENLQVIDVVLRNNRVTDGRGGGLGITSNSGEATYLLDHLEVFGNEAHRPDDTSANGARGGGLFLEGRGVLQRSEIYSNTADFTGGGVSTGSNNANPLIDRCYIHDNQAGVGGGFSVFLTGGATLQNSLLVRNKATSATGLLSGQTNQAILGGNAIHTPYVGLANEPLNVINVTIADNTGAVPDAVKVEGANTARVNHFTNVLISGSQVGIASNGQAVATVDKVLIADDVATKTTGFGAGDLTGTPLGGVAGFVGGDDYHLTSLSDAVDAGATVTLTVDLEGTPRPQGDGFDIGAYEVDARQPQTITFPALLDRALDQSPFTLSATSTSSLPVSFSSQTPAVCTVSGKSVTLVAEGFCTITASQAGDLDFLPAEPVTRSFTVLPAGTPTTSDLFLPEVSKRKQ